MACRSPAQRVSGAALKSSVKWFMSTSATTVTGYEGIFTQSGNKREKEEEGSQDGKQMDKTVLRLVRIWTDRRNQIPDRKSRKAFFKDL